MEDGDDGDDEAELAEEDDEGEDMEDIKFGGFPELPGDVGVLHAGIHLTAIPGNQ
ncbi:hypothetical protein PQR63_02925 [Herbaspirillum rhizosphaerae]|uniref:Uncharacterized protein n=1 Tax=Herbaspirillum rhizosphaerae TaxID=346179 RepID=A0ABW8Z4A8_9BURK